MVEPGVTIEEASPRSIAGIGAFADRARLLSALRAEFGIDIPAGSRWVQAGTFALSCLAPARFLVSGPPDAALPARLARSLAGLAAVTDQSDMWTVFLVSGAGVRDVLARLVPVDLDEDRFLLGDLALTRAGHLDVRLWRSGEESYEIAVTRSFGRDLADLLFLKKKKQKDF